MNEYEQFNHDESLLRGIDPAVSARVAWSEGGLDEPAKRGTFPTGSSWWAYQLHYGGTGYEYLGTVAGMGNGFTKLTGWQPGDPAAWRDAMRYALNRVKANGWGAWYGAAAVGISQWEGIDRNHPFDVNSQIWDYEGSGGVPGGPAPMVYNPAQPPERQVQSWTCSIRATSWMLKSLGLPVDIGALQDEMSPRYVTPAVGLLDGRGYGIAEVLRAHLPVDWHPRIEVHERVSWAELVALAGKGPVALGLHNAYHWINIAGITGDGSLSSPNPAPKYPAGDPIGDTLTEDEFLRWGPASAVFIRRTPATQEAPSPSDFPPELTAIAHLVDVVVPSAFSGNSSALNEAAVIRKQFVG